MSGDDYGHGYDRGYAVARSYLREEILDLCDAIDQGLIDYTDIATKLRAIVADKS